MSCMSCSLLCSIELGHHCSIAIFNKLLIVLNTLNKAREVVSTPWPFHLSCYLLQLNTLRGSFYTALCVQHCAAITTSVMGGTTRGGIKRGRWHFFTIYNCRAKQTDVNQAKYFQFQKIVLVITS